MCRDLCAIAGLKEIDDKSGARTRLGSICSHGANGVHRH
jgi:hypothetical protein